ncbi:MAG: KAP family NTPase [Clostridia bacterium]|nr:KAP family NTPase [Clostridia bacterium]
MEELIECICEYIRKPYTDYAVMINGEWGSGKTYFWNNKLRNRIESITVNGKKYKTIYMSLYGINSLEEISKKIFIETNPMISKTLKKFVDSREGNLIPEYVKTGLDMANLFGTMQFSSDKLDFSKLFTIDDKILCFDDLERANVDVIDILGYINNFVEHDGIKTILICNENELATKFKNNNVELKTLIATIMLDKEGKLVSKADTKNESDSYEKPLANLLEEKITDIFDRANAYERIKEKLIGETFEYIPEYSYILSGMIMKYSYNEQLSEFYKRNNSTIIAAFNKSKTRNLRILKHALNDFEKIFNNVVRDFPDISHSVLRTILTFTIAVSFEIKAGNISKEKLKSIKDNDEYTSIIFTSKILNDNNQFYLREFDNKYFLNNAEEYRFFKFVEVYIRTRYFDEKLYKENMKVATNKLTSTSKINEHRYLKILNGDYLKLSDFDFDTLSKQVLEEIRQGKIEFKEHVKIFCIYKYLIKSGLVDINMTELKSAYQLGLQVAASQCPNIDLIENDIDFDYDKEDKDTLWAVNQYVKTKERAIEEKAIEKASELFKNLPNNIQEFYKGIVGDYQNLPVFSKYDMEDLYNKFELTPNYDLYNIVNMFHVRYENKKELFKADSKNLKKLCDIIDKSRGSKDKTIKKVLLGNISNIINSIAESYEVKM